MLCNTPSIVTPVSNKKESLITAFASRHEHGHAVLGAQLRFTERVPLPPGAPGDRRAAHQHVDGIIHHAKYFHSIDGLKRQDSHGKLLFHFVKKRFLKHPVYNLFDSLRLFAQIAVRAERIAWSRLRRQHRRTP